MWHSLFYLTKKQLVLKFDLFLFLQVVNKMDLKRLTEKAARSAASYNSYLMNQRREERKCYYDIPTGVGATLGYHYWGVMNLLM